MKAAPQILRAGWCGIGLTINWTPVWFAMGDGSYSVAHLEIIADERAPLPITATGYRSHFTQAADIEAHGGPIAFALAWLERDAASPAWKIVRDSARQLSLL
ncbi:MAG: hypothetical protein ABII76_13780 [Pseudomonadota bacterium]